MSRAVITINGQTDREKAARWSMATKAGMRIEFKQAKRSGEQNDKLWAMLTEIAAQVPWHGIKLTPDDWKFIFLDALKRELRMVPNIDGNGFVNLGRSSSDLSKSEMSDMIELIHAFGAQHNVVFRDTESSPASGDASQEASLPESEPQTSDSTNSELVVSKTVSSGFPSLNLPTGSLGTPGKIDQAPNSNPLQSLSPQIVAAAASAESSPVPSVDANPSPDEGEKSSGDGVSESTASSSLPVGWGILYAAALRAAPDKKGLTPAARKYWAQYGGWGNHKDGPDAQTAIAIFDAFSNNFGRGEVIDFALRELI